MDHQAVENYCGKIYFYENGITIDYGSFRWAYIFFIRKYCKNIRKIFDFASRQECILFLDEFDVIAKVRDDKNETGELKGLLIV